MGGWAAAGNDPKGAGVYNIITLAQYTNITGLVAADGYGDHLLTNGNIALLNTQEIKIEQFGATGDGTTDDTLSIQAAYDRATVLSVGIVRFEIPVGDGRISSASKPTVHWGSGKFFITATIIVGSNTITIGERSYVFSTSLTFNLFQVSTYNTEWSGMIFDGGISHIYLSSSSRIESALTHIHDCEFRVCKTYCLTDDISTHFAYPANVYVNNVKSYGSSFLSLHNNGTFISNSWFGWDVAHTGTDDLPLFDGGTPLILENISDIPFGTNTDRTPRIRQTGTVGIHGPRSLHLTCRNYRFGGEATKTPILACDIEDDADADVEFNSCAMFGVADYFWAEFENNLPRRLVVTNCKGTDSVDSTGFTNTFGIRVGTSVDPLNSKYQSLIEFGNDVPSRAQRFIITDDRTGSVIPTAAVSADFIMNPNVISDNALSLKNYDGGDGFRVDLEPYTNSGGGAIGGTVVFAGFTYRRYDFQDPTENVRITIPGLTPLGGAGIYSCSVDVLPQNGTCTYEGGYQRAAAAVATNTITAGGTFSGSDGQHRFKMASTSGSGVGLSGTLTIASNTVSSIDSIDSGSGYAVSDTVILTINGASQSVACTLTVNSISSAAVGPKLIITNNGICERNYNQVTWKFWYNGTDPVDVSVNITSVASAANTQIGIGRFYINYGDVAGNFTPANVDTLEQINKMHYGNGAPTNGTWTQGSIVWDANPAVGSPIGYMCTVSGTPGTWVAFANL